MEGVLGSVDTSFSGFRQFFGMLDTNPSKVVKEWTIVDVDNFLRGNPHVQG